MLTRLLHEPLVREIGQPLLIMLSLKNDLIWFDLILIQGEEATLWVILSFWNQDAYCNKKNNYFMSSLFHKLTCQYLVYIQEAIPLFYDQECSCICNKLHKINEYQNRKYCSAYTAQYVQHCQHLQRKSSLSMSS